MSPARLSLIVILRAMAVMASLAAVPVFMPHNWMDQVHRLLGLGELPTLPVIIYLSRSLSAMYVFHGLMLWLVSTDLGRYRPLVVYLGLAFTLFGLVTLGIDAHAGVPWYWTAVEGPTSFLVGLAILYLQQRVGQEKASP